MPYTFDSDDIRTYLARQYRQARGRAKSILRRPAQTFDNNNNFAQRVTLNPSGGSAAFNNTGYTTESGEPNPGGSFRSGWYQITPTERRIYQFRMTAIPTSSTSVIEYYSGSGSPLSGLARLTTRWSDEDGGDSARRSFSSRNLGWDATRLNDWMEVQLPAETVKVQMGVTNTVHQGAIAFEWAAQTPPANDDLADAIELVGELGTESGTLVGATWDTTLFQTTIWPEYTDPGSFNEWVRYIRGIVWYKVTSGSESVYRFTLEPTGSGEDMRIIVLQGDLSEGVRNGWGRPDEPIDVQLTTSEYWVGVVALNLGSTDEYDFTRWRDTFDLHWEILDNPENDYFAFAEEITGNTGTSTNDDLVGSTLEADEVVFTETGETELGTVWWQYTPTTSGLYTFTTATGLTSDQSQILACYKGTEIDDLALVGQDVRFLDNSAFSLSVALRAGESYYLRINIHTVYDAYAHLSDTDYGGLSWNLVTAAPANDDFENAEVISGSSGTVSGNNAGATFEDGEPEPPYDADAFLESVWYQWEAPSSGYFRFETNGAEDQDLGVFVGDTVDDLTPVVTNIDGKDPVDNFNAILEFEAVEGTTYYIRVDFGRAAFDLDWQTATAPANDLFASATVLASTESGGPTSYDNLGADADLELQEPSPLADIGDPELLLGRSVWWNFTPPTPGLYEFTVDAPAFTSFLVLYELDGTAEFSNLTQLDYIETSYDTQSVQGQMETDKTYYVQLLGGVFFDGTADPADTWGIEQGQFSLEWTRVAQAPANDNLSAALTVADAVGNIANSPDAFRPSGGCYDATSRDATAQVGELSVAGFGPQRTVWFVWVPMFNGTARFWTSSGAVTDQAMAVYESNFSYSPAAPGTLLDADDDSGPGLMPQCEFTTTSLTEYLIQVDTKDNPGGEFTLNWVRVTASPPINDNFADAIELVGDGPTTLSGTSVDATVECDEPAQDGDGPFGSVWYHITSLVERDIAVTLKATSDANDGGIKAIFYRGSTLGELEDVTGGNYPWVFDLNEQQTVTWQLAAGVDYYISVSNYQENDSGADGATFDITHELSTITTPDGDPFEAPIDSSPSAGGGPVLTGTTEGATTQDGEPEVNGIAGTVWHKFIPDYDGIYIFEAEADDPAVGYGGRMWFSVWEGPSLASIKPIPGYYGSQDGFASFLGNNPRVLRAGSEYYVRIERFDGDLWGSYTLNITAYPEYDDWESAGAGYDSVNGSGSYDSLNDQLTYTGEGGALVTPWRDLDDNPQNAGLRWIQMRFKMRVTSGETMHRADHFNALGVVRALNPDDDSVWELILTGNADGTNSLAVRDPDDGDTRTMFAHFGTRGRDFNEWVDVEVVLRAYDNRFAVPTTYSTDVATNGVKKRALQTFDEDGVPATAPIRTLEFGAFYYPDSYDTTITGAGSPRQDPHDDWEIQIKDVVVRNRPTLGMLPPTDTGDLGVTQFDGWEHEDKLDNVDPTGLAASGATIVDAPGVPPGNADWWKAVRILNASPTDYPKGLIYNYWLHNCRPWMGFWVYFTEFPTTGSDDYMVFSSMSDMVGVGIDQVRGWAALMINEDGELRIAPQISERVWKSYCVARLQTDTWYWVELEADVSILHESTVDVSINGNAMGSFQYGPSFADIQALPGFNLDTYSRFYTSGWPVSWQLGPIMRMEGTGTAFQWTPQTNFSVEVDMYFAHVCMGRAVTFPLGPMQTKLFGGIDADADHNFPDLPADVDDYEQLHTSTRENIWTLYDFTIETEDPDPAVSGSPPAGISWQSPPGGDTIDVIADGTGGALIAAYNAIRWKPRTTIPDSPFGTRHFPQFGNTPYDIYTTPQGGTGADMFVQTAWAKGVGNLSFQDQSDPGNGSMPSHISRALTGTYAQFWSAAPTVWHPMLISATASTDGEWSGMTASDFMYWKRARILLNPKVYPRFALSADNGATWTMLDDPTVSNTNTFIGSDVTVSNGEAVFMDNTSAITRLFEFNRGILFPFGDYGMHSVGYEANDWYLEYESVPSVEIPEAEEFGGTRGYNLHLRHAGYRYTPSTERVAGDLYVTLWNGTHRSPMYVVTATTSDISRVRYPTDATGGHWTTTEFGDTLLRFGYYRALSSSSSPGSGLNPSPGSWLNSQFRGALLEAVQWEVLSQAAPGPSAQRCRRLQQIYRRAFG